ncbi:MAG TPA: DUF47 domain-containing protein [Opitutaceae bacterium]|nr:DUF47 domain-containing protein [Opitutaceae bacterium]
MRVEARYGRTNMQQTAGLRWWHRIIGRDDKFYVLLEEGAQEVKTSVNLLSAYLEARSKGLPTPPEADFTESRRRQKQIRTETVAELNKSLVPPFDRQDIQALAYALYRVPKAIERLVERISIYPGRIPYAGFTRQAEYLTIAADGLVTMVHLLCSGADIEKVGVANARLQAAEGEADKMMLQLLQELYAGPFEAKEVVIVNKLYEMMERAVDRCRNVGNLVVQITLKQT